MRRTSRIATLSLALALCLGVAACQRGPETAPDSEHAAEKPTGGAVRVPLQGAKLKGADRALVTVVEFSDYQCPFCKKAHQTVESLLGDYQGRVRLAVFESPLPFHTRAKPAAAWAFAAGEQGKYWQARDLLFEGQRSLDEDALAGMARTLGLDPERLERDRRSIAADRAVQGGIDLAAAVGAKGTPTFFVNGHPIIGAQPAAVFRAAIDTALTGAEALVARGIRPEDVYAEIMKTASPAIPAPAKAKPAARPNPAAGAHPGEKPAKANGNANAKNDGDCGGDCGGDCKGNTEVDADPPVVQVDLGNAPSRGAADAKVTIVVFTDFECPFCRKGEDTLRTLEAEYKGKLRIVHKNYPLPMHDHARLAAAASIAAQRQGKFWEYHDVLFQHGDALDRPALLEYALNLGLDLARFEKDLDDPATRAAIDADEAQVLKLGIQGTPAFFINGRRLDGAQPAAIFRASIDRALAER